MYDLLEAEANLYGMTLAQFLAAPWNDAMNSTIYQELFDKLNGIAQQYGFNLNDYITSGWNNGQTAISSYDGVFANSASSTIAQLEAIKNGWQQVVAQINAAAQAEVEYIKKQNEANNASNNAGNAAAPDTGSTPTPDSGSSATPERTEDEYTGVALAIWNGNYGWGDGKDRVERLTAKGFDAAKVQDLVNQMGEDGYVYTNAWKKKYGITDLTPYHFNKFAKGTTGVKKDQWAIIDELGDELVMHAAGGRLAFLSKGSAVIPHNISENLMELGSMDPQDMLDRNRPQITAPHVVNNEININMNIAEVVHIDKVTNDTIPDLTKAVKKEMESYMTSVNNAIRSKAR